MKCDAPDWAPERLSKSADVKPIHATWRRLIEGDPKLPSVYLDGETEVIVYVRISRGWMCG